MMPLGRKVVAQLTAEGYDAALVNPRFIKPLDTGVTEFFGHAADVLVTMEDHVLMGGYGSAVLELLNEKRIPTPVIQIGWPDHFIEHASTTDELRSKYGLTVENTLAKVRAEFSSAAGAAQSAVLQLR
jgi:1-deoxy-D-xylulose-5-phosphate synthase